MFEKEEIVNPFDWIKSKVTQEDLDVVLFGSPGNLGDTLIVAATIQCLENRDIAYRVGSEQYDSEAKGNELYVIMGGGNYIPLYNSVKSLLEHLARKVPGAKVVILPSSSFGMEKHLKSLDLEIYFFCREQETLKSINKALPKQNVFLSHDAALYIDLQDAKFKGMRNLRKVLKGKSCGTLYAIREDREKTENFKVEKHHKNIDVSSLRTNRGAAVLSKHAIIKDLVFEDVNFMFMYLLPFDEIVSDRLHVCIAGLLLGKKVTMYDNSYGKLSNVYKNSLVDKYKDNIDLKL
ncbi:polysaccharide pyruvyl transferase family protein [Paraglaciecola marina]|uniref:polysaccharide pyruvyl transferase family protein n=1 Tax=Paraglaciecola marina TaxID=2500157 RepID=UPI0014152F35|nr:polysaccharide pyruvyl transferase family protein [Paraglaciecola marina]